jgi:hypothetical protein
MNLVLIPLSPETWKELKAVIGFFVSTLKLHYLIPFLGTNYPKVFPHSLNMRLLTACCEKLIMRNGIIPDLVANYPKHALHSLQIKDVIWIPDMGSGII